MMSFILPAILSIIFVALFVIFTIIAVIKKEHKKFSGLAAIISAMITLIASINVNIPKPTIYPLDSEARIYTEDVEVKMDFINFPFSHTYYSLDGNDPKEGNIYDGSLFITESTTVAARNKFLIWWSDVSKNAYRFEDITQEDDPPDHIPESSSESLSTPTPEPSQIVSNSDEDETQKSNSNNTYEQQPDIKSSDDNNETETKTSTNNEKIKITETHTPNDVVTSVSVIDWNSNSDIGIDGNMYDGGLKVIMSNMFTSMGSGVDNNIISRITIPLSDSQKNTEEKVFYGTFVLDQSMFGSNSSGIIKIIINNKEVFSTGDIDGNTTDSFPFNVNYEGADTIIIEATVTLRGSDFIYGLVNSKE